MIKILKNDKGIVIADALIAVLIMTIFLGLILTLTYNIYIAANFTKRNSKALDYGIKIIEYIDKIPYDNVNYDDISNGTNTVEGLINYINNIDPSFLSAKRYDDEFSLTTPYRVKLKVENYNETEGNTTKQDIIKIVTIIINYNLGDAEKEVVFERVKKK